MANLTTHANIFYLCLQMRTFVETFLTFLQSRYLSKTLELITNGPSGHPFFADTFYNNPSDSPTMITSFFSIPFHLKWSSTVKRGKTLVDTRTSNNLPINEPAHLLRSGPLIRILVSQMLPWKNLASNSKGFLSEQFA